MTPKEKAQELVDKMYSCPYVQESDAKRCALIAVDEIIFEREVIYASIGIPQGTFWYEVKEEIKKL